MMGDMPTSRHRAGAPPLTPMAWLRRDAIGRAVSEVRPGSILEIGAGQGAMGWRLARLARYVGVEPDERSAAVATERIGSLPGAQVRRGSIEQVAGAERFDLVCAFEVLEHIEDDVAALLAWRSHLDPDGALLLSVPAHRSRFGPSDVAVGHHRRYDLEDLRATLVAAGFAPSWIEPYGGGAGHVLEWVRNRALSRRTPADPAEATSSSGRLFQPGPFVGGVVGVAMVPARWMQRPLGARGWGVGWVALARIAPSSGDPGVPAR